MLVIRDMVHLRTSRLEYRFPVAGVRIALRGVVMNGRSGSSMRNAGISLRSFVRSRTRCRPCRRMDL